MYNFQCKNNDQTVSIVIQIISGTKIDKMKNNFENIMTTTVNVQIFTQSNYSTNWGTCMTKEVMHFCVLISTLFYSTYYT